MSAVDSDDQESSYEGYEGSAYAALREYVTRNVVGEKGVVFQGILENDNMMDVEAIITTLVEDDLSGTDAATLKAIEDLVIDHSPFNVPAYISEADEFFRTVLEPKLRKALRSKGIPRMLALLVAEGNANLK
jgi:hypothetical protein